MRPVAREVDGPLGYTAQQSRTSPGERYGGTRAELYAIAADICFFFAFARDVLGNNEIGCASMKFCKSNHLIPPSIHQKELFIIS